MRYPVGSWYQTQPAINAFQVGWRLAGRNSVRLAVGHSGLPSTWSDGTDDGTVGGWEWSGRAVAATITLTAATATAAPPAASPTSRGRWRDGFGGSPRTLRRVPWLS